MPPSCFARAAGRSTQRANERATRAAAELPLPRLAARNDADQLTVVEDRKAADIVLQQQPDHVSHRGTGIEMTPRVMTSTTFITVLLRKSAATIGAHAGPL